MLAVLHEADQGSPNYGPPAKLRPAGQTTARKAILSVMKNNIFTENLLTWQNITYPATITLRKTPGLDMFCITSCGHRTKTFGDPWSRLKQNKTSSQQFK